MVESTGFLCLDSSFPLLSPCLLSFTAVGVVLLWFFYFLVAAPLFPCSGFCRFCSLGYFVLACSISNMCGPLSKSLIQVLCSLTPLVAGSIWVAFQLLHAVVSCTVACCVISFLLHWWCWVGQVFCINNPLLCLGSASAGAVSMSLLLCDLLNVAAVWEPSVCRGAGAAIVNVYSFSGVAPWFSLILL